MKNKLRSYHTIFQDWRGESIQLPPFPFFLPSVPLSSSLNPFLPLSIPPTPSFFPLPTLIYHLQLFPSLPALLFPPRRMVFISHPPTPPISTFQHFPFVLSPSPSPTSILLLYNYIPIQSALCTDYHEPNLTHGCFVNNYVFSVQMTCAL